MKITGFKGFKFPPPQISRSQISKEEFGTFLKNEIKRVDSLQKEAISRLEDFATGKSRDLVDLTFSLTQAELSFKLLLRVRNKALEAYQEIMRMQI